MAKKTPYQPSNIFALLKQQQKQAAQVVTGKMHKAARGMNYAARTTSARSKPKPNAEHVIEKDYYRLYITSPDTIEIMFKFASDEVSMRAKLFPESPPFEKKAEIIFYDLNGWEPEKIKDISKLPKELREDVERIFHARSMY